MQFAISYLFYFRLFTAAKYKSIMNTFLSNRNINNAISMVPELDEDYTFKYFLQKRFGNDIQGAIKTVLSADKDNQAVMLLVAHMNTHNSGLIKMKTEELVLLLTRLASDIAKMYLENRYAFRNPLKIKTNRVGDVKDILTNVWSRDINVVNRFFAGIAENIIKLESVVPELHYLATHGDKRAWGLLGDIYYYGLGEPRDQKKAMEYFINGKKARDAYSCLGIGRMLMQKPYTDLEQALNIFNEGLELSNDPEILFHKYLLLKNRKTGPWEVDGLLHLSAFAGYLPAVFEMAISLQYNVLSNVVTSLRSVTINSPRFVPIYEKAWNAYKNRDYWTATVLYLYLSEFGLEPAIENALILLETQQVFETDHNRLLYSYLEELAWTGREHGRSIGDCHKLGKGTEQSDGKAFGYFLASCNYCDESLYNVACMFETGTGVPKNLSQAYFYIFKSFKNSDSYLVFFYARLRIFIKLAVHLYFNSYVASALVISATYLFFKAC